MSELPERYKTCGRCVHDGEGDPNIAGSYCYLCKRNWEDHRIDWFQEKETKKNDNDELMILLVCSRSQIRQFMWYLTDLLKEYNPRCEAYPSFTDISDSSRNRIVIEPGVDIVFMMSSKSLLGLRPDYYCTNQPDAYEYLESTGAKKLSTWSNLVEVVKDYISERKEN